MKSFADLFGLFVLFLSMTATFGSEIGTIPFEPSAPAEEQTLRVMLTPTQLALGIGGEGPLHPLWRTPRGDIDPRWVAEEVEAFALFKPIDAALWVGDEVTLGDLIRVADACRGAGIRVRLRDEMRTLDLP